MKELCQAPPARKPAALTVAVLFSASRTAPHYAYPDRLLLGCRLEHCFDHRVADLVGLDKPRLEELLRLEEPLPPCVEVTQRHTLGPPSRRECELEVVAPEGVVLDRDPERLVQPVRVPKEVLRHAQPKPEQGRRADHVVVGRDPQRGPAVHHGEQREVVVGQGPHALLGLFAQGEPVQQVVAEQGGRRPPGRVLAAEDALAGAVHAGAQAGCVPLQHQLVQLRRAARVLRDLLAGLGVEDREPRVDVPPGAVDAHRQVDLDVLDPADVAGAFPRELLHRVPGFPHREEGGVGHGLGVGGDAVVLERAEVDVLGVEAAEDRLDLAERGIGRSVFDENLGLVSSWRMWRCGVRTTTHQGLPFRINVGSVERMARHDVDICG